MPNWSGATSNILKDNTASWSLLKIKVKRALENKKTGANLGLTKKFWRTADWTVVIACQFDVLGDHGDGTIDMLQGKI